MNQMTGALAKVGITIPVTQRIWMWLADNGEHTCTQIASALKLTRERASGVLVLLVRRRMVIAVPEFDRRLQRHVNRYKVNPAMNNIYEMLPMPPELTRAERKKLALMGKVAPILNISSAALPAIAPSPRTGFNPETHLEKLTLQELRQTYEFLKGMFK